MHWSYRSLALSHRYHIDHTQNSLWTNIPYVALMGELWIGLNVNILRENQPCYSETSLYIINWTIMLMHRPVKGRKNVIMEYCRFMFNSGMNWRLALDRKELIKPVVEACTFQSTNFANDLWCKILFDFGSISNLSSVILVIIFIVEAL